MSLEGSYTTQIKIPETQLQSRSANIKEAACMEILRLAMEKVVRDRGGLVDSSYTDNEGGVRKCLLAVRTVDFERGVGAVLEPDGKVTFHYDAYGDSHGLGRLICEEITQNYVTIAVLRAQKRLGFQVHLKERTRKTGKKTVYVTGVMQ